MYGPYILQRSEKYYTPRPLIPTIVKVVEPKISETQYFFMEYFIKMLKAGGRAGVAIKNTFLSNTDNASVALRKQLLEECNLHTILDCQAEYSQGVGVKTVVLFFEKRKANQKNLVLSDEPGPQPWKIQTKKEEKVLREPAEIIKERNLLKLKISLQPLMKFLRK